MAFNIDDKTSIRDIFAGQVTRLDSYDIPASNGLYAQNCAFLHGQVAKRLGTTATVALTDGAITSMVNWQFTLSGTDYVSVVYYAPSVGVRSYAQIGGSLATVMSQTGAAGAVVVPNSERLYGAFYTATGRLGYAQGQVYGQGTGGDPLFAAPLQIAITASETGSGLCTAGAHRIGYMTTTRNGYTGKLCPVDINTNFTPIAFTSSGSKNIHLSIATTGVLPTYMIGGNIQIVMATVANPNTYYAVPGAVALANNLGATTITISIDDYDLAATGTDVTAYTLLLTQSAGGSAPFNPSSIFTYSSRVCYAMVDQYGFPGLAISDPNNYQSLTADQHIIYLAGQDAPVSGCELRGVCYIASEQAFYSAEDNGDVPVTWVPPAKVDGSIGILAPDCLTFNPSLGYAGVASIRGLYLFQGGIFPPLPLSYYNDQDWQRINWNVPTTVKLLDDAINKRFIVLAPLTTIVQSVTGSGPYTVTTAIVNSKGQHVTWPHLYQTGLAISVAGVGGTPTVTVTGATTFTMASAPTVGAVIYPQTANARMTFDYTEGDSPEEIKYNVDYNSSYLSGAAAIIRNHFNNKLEVWFAPSANGWLMRQNDGTESNAYRDATTAGSQVASTAIWETSLIPGQDDQSTFVRSFDGAHLRIEGTAVSLAVFSLDHVRSITPAASPLALSGTPGKEYLVKWNIVSEHQSIQFSNSDLDGWFSLARIEAGYTELFPQR